MSEQIWTQQQRENTMRQLAQKMSHLTSRPFADLIKLATSLEEMAFTKAAGSQKEYITVLSKRMKKLEAQFTGQQPPALSQASSFAPVAQQPQQYQQPQAAMAQHQHQLFLQQQQQQQQHQQQLVAQQQQQMHLQKSQQQQQQQQAHSTHHPQQSTGLSTGSHEEDFANMADMFGLYNGGPSTTATSQQASQAFLQTHAQRLQQQQAMMPQIPRQGLAAEQLKQQQQQQQLFQQQQFQQQQQLFQQQQQRQQQMRQQQQAQQARQQQPQQQQHQLHNQQQAQQQQAQQAQQPGYLLQSQPAASWQQAAASNAHLQANQLQANQQQIAPGTQVQPGKDIQARIAQFWEIQVQLKKRYLPQLQALKDIPFMRSQHVGQATREYMTRATHICLLRQDDPHSIAAVEDMTESKLASIRKLFHELDGRLKALNVTLVKLQQVARTASAQRAQSQTPPPSQGVASPSPLSRPATPKASAPPSSAGEAIGMAPNSRTTSLLAEAAPNSAPAPPHPLPPAAAVASEAATAPIGGGMSQPGQAQTEVAPVSAELQAATMAGVAFPPATHTQTDSEHLPASSAQAAPSLISAVTQANGAKGGATAATAGPTMQSLLEDGHVFMPALPAELQAELASSASSSFNGMATFELMQQQLSSTFDSSTILAGDMAADMLSSPRFAVTDQEMKGGSGEGTSAAAASVAAVNAAVSEQMSPGMGTAAFNAAAGAAISRSQTAPPRPLDLPLPQTPTMISALASTAYAEEAGADPNSPASVTTAHMGASHQKGGKCFETMSGHSSHSAPCLSGLGKRRASESNVATQMDVKRSRAHLAHVEAAIKQASETFQGVARLEATDSLYSQDCIMLTCTPMADSATADSADTWRVITLQISSLYPSEPPSVVVRMSRDAQLAPQGEAVRSVLETSLSTLPFPPTLEGILRCWLSAIGSVGKAFSSQNSSASQANLQAPALGQLGTSFSQPSSFPMQVLMSGAAPAVISMGSLLPHTNPTVGSLGSTFPTLSGSAATAGVSFSALASSNATAGAPFSSLGTPSATAATLFGGSGIPQVPTPRHRSLQKQLSTGTQHSHAMLGAIQPGMATASMLPTGTSPSMYSARAVSNPMGSIESLVSAGLLPQASLNSSQGSLSSSHAVPQTSLGHLAALLDLPRSSALIAGTPMQGSGLH